MEIQVSIEPSPWCSFQLKGFEVIQLKIILIYKQKSEYWYLQYFESFRFLACCWLIELPLLQKQKNNSKYKVRLFLNVLNPIFLLKNVCFIWQQALRRTLWVFYLHQVPALTVFASGCGCRRFSKVTVQMVQSYLENVKKKQSPSG